MSGKIPRMNVNLLRHVRTIVTHDNCADGIASALILHAALPDARIVFVQYGDARHRELPAEPGMLFCDMTPPAERAGEFAIAGALVLDHHKRQEDVVKAFGVRGRFADEKLNPGVSGAVLAFREVFLPMASGDLALGMREDAALRLARLVGIRDTWQKDDPSFDRASAISEALRFIPFDRLLALDLCGMTAYLESLGNVLVERKQASALDLAARAVRIYVDRLRIAVIPSTTLTSDVCELVDADLVAGFAYGADEGGQRVRLSWSLRSRAGVDVSAIAARHGGGGHTAAAGFSVHDDGRSPYVRASELLRV